MSYIQPPNKLLYSEQVWDIARKIPYGKVATYGQLAKLIACPVGISAEDYKLSAARWVGSALFNCPNDVPWQRVVNARGMISHNAEPGKQRKLLEAEGVLFSTDKVSTAKISLPDFQWRGLDQSQSNSPVQDSLFKPIYFSHDRYRRHRMAHKQSSVPL